ncbi:hypothetical protein MVLG_02062 [Microbotryum lychnidis-dioicae p1A1 Lamole]|uniref:Uncharacterized protein n=1 Tax=Microbotryum lychnidis-dioicae (strain p1A1 Lamole / MvSl-1064) TaxID=683840 RepID=U5H411_USTV1|nr:hypothetical protein MVLG_02062 [Microbotryum lychnidis-dioicae p1A1 Lamole]|eukprot:KDE07596.1 hypothetical protein MVLG_02062 [Microbotryum lychnidis-dioicae p1A1 Lamole]
MNSIQHPLAYLSLIMGSHAELRKNRKSQRTAEKQKPPDYPDASRETDSSPSTNPSFIFDLPPRSSSTAARPPGRLPLPNLTPKSMGPTTKQHQRRIPRQQRRLRLEATLWQSPFVPPSEDREIEWAGLRDFFLSPSTEDSNIDTTMVPKIVWNGGNPTVKSKGRFVSFTEENEGELDDPEAMPDLVLLTREAYEANTDLPSIWRNSGDDNSKTAAEDVKTGRPSWTQVASIGEFNKRPIDATKFRFVYADVRVRRSLEVLAAESIRSHAFGVFVHGNQIVIYLHTPFGLFYSPDIYCTEKNGYLSTILARVLSLSDRELGIIVSLCDDAFPSSYTFPYSELPPSADPIPRPPIADSYAWQRADS